MHYWNSKALGVFSLKMTGAFALGDMEIFFILRLMKYNVSNNYEFGEVVLMKLPIQDCTNEDKEYLVEKLVDYNLSKVQANQSELFIDLSRKIEKDGKIIAGIIARMYCWNVVYIDTLWVDSNYRSEKLGTLLLKSVEQQALSNNVYLIHLDTFDFQAKEFYEKQGYEVFGQLDNCPRNHTRYYMKKDF